MTARENTSPAPLWQQSQGETSAPAVTFTVDVEDHLRAGTPSRFPAMTRRLLDFLEEHGISGTFFIEGMAALAAPGLVREIARRGHEIGSHSYHHVLLDREHSDGFRAGMRDTKRHLEDLTGHAVIGFRAPAFSLTPASRWAVGVLAELGFAYSSSVVPGPALVSGYPGAPRHPFAWAEGLLEIPCPVGQIGRWAVPFQGGMYLRYLPPWRYRWLQAQLGDQANWTYCHPYDIDVDERFSRLAWCGWSASALLWANRRVTLRRWERLAVSPGRPFGERLQAFRQQATRKQALLF